MRKDVSRSAVSLALVVVAMTTPIGGRLPIEGPVVGPPREASDDAAAIGSRATAAARGLAASDWASIRSAYERHGHSAVETTNGWMMTNADQQWQTHFGDKGFIVRPDDSSWSWGLELTSYGFRGHEVAPSVPPAVTANGPRVLYDRDGTVQEWFVNDRSGLEHGFIIRRRPESGGAPGTRLSQTERPAPLTLSLAVTGSLDPEVMADGQSVQFNNEQGAAVVTYAGLTVWDADGTILRAAFEPVTASDRTLRLRVDESAARYPLTIDPIAQQAYLKASNVDVKDQFGWAVAISGDTVVIGAPHESSNATGVNGNQANNGAPSSGAAYVFVRSGGVWSQQAYLKASNADSYDLFGSSVAVSGDTVLVGAPDERSKTGAPTDNSGGAYGAVYAFVRTGGVWSQQAYLKSPDLSSPGRFGWSVAADNGTAVVGEPEKNIGAGEASVFYYSSAGWSGPSPLAASNAHLDDRFGTSVAIRGATIAVGADRHLKSGAAYVFVYRWWWFSWIEQAELRPFFPGLYDSFGSSVAVGDDMVVVGAPYEDSDATGVNVGNQGAQANDDALDAGAAYLFVRTGSAWNQQLYLKPSNTANLAGFGYSVGIANSVVVVGAPFESGSGTALKPQSGAVYVFAENRFRTAWTQLAYLKASDSGSNDKFGIALGVSGGLFVAGATGEDSMAVGVNGDGSDNSAPNSGAAYVFDLYYQKPFKPWP